MAELLDSGARREFGNGAVRDVAEGKGRCDLLPLRVIAVIDGDTILEDIDAYVRNGTVRNLRVAIKNFACVMFGNFYTAMLEVAKQYEDGARKYDDRNWEKGIPVHVFIDSGVRHYLKYLRGDTDEPHDRAFIWNMLGAIWTHENKPELIDLPFAEQSKPNRPTQADLEDLFTDPQEPIGFAETAPSEPVKGKYEGLSNSILKECVCTHFIDCGDGCPLYVKYQTYKCENIWIANHPEEFRKIAIEYLEGLEGK